MDKNGQRVACKNWNVYSPQRQNNLIFFWLPYSGLGKAVAGINPGRATQWDALAFLPHPTDITDIAPPPPTRPFASVRFDPLAWSSGSDQRRISGCGIRWLLAGPDSLPLWLCRVCAFVLLRCFSCSHTVLPKAHSLGVIFFSSLSSCKCCIFLQFYLHFTTDYTCMIVYVTNNKEPWTLNCRHHAFFFVFLTFATLYSFEAISSKNIYLGLITPEYRVPVVFIFVSMGPGKL